MPNVFISYRHDDSFDAKLLVEHLKRWLPLTRSLTNGNRGRGLRAILATHTDRAQVVLVIGTRWMAIEQPGGHRRLDDPDDVVRWEIARAVAARKRIIPVLVDGGRLPAEADLPSALQSLARLQYCEIGRRTFEGDIQGLARTLSADSAAADPARFIFLVKRSLVVVPVVSAVLCAVAWSNLFAKVEIWFANRITWLGDGLFDIPLSDQLRIVSLPLEPRDGSGSDPSREAVRLDPSRRADFAALLDELVRQGARVVVFDVTLTQESSFDDRLAESVKGAVARGVQVGFGFKAFDAATNQPDRERGRARAPRSASCVGDRGEGMSRLPRSRSSEANARTRPAADRRLRIGPAPWLTAASSEVQVPGARAPSPSR
jgi:hypothetical protein